MERNRDDATVYDVLKEEKNAKKGGGSAGGMGGGRRGQADGGQFKPHDDVRSSQGERWHTHTHTHAHGERERKREVLGG